MFIGKKKGNTFRVISACMVFFFASVLILPKEAVAYRSNAGGGDTAEFDFGFWVLGNVVGLVSSGLGSAIGSGIGNALGISKIGFMESLSSLSGLGSWATNFVTNTAVGQAQYAVGMMGNYYGWDPKSTIFISSIAGGVVGGGLSPGHFGSSIGSMAGGGVVTQTLGASISALEGMGIGLIEGAVEGAILMSAADKRGHIEPWAGALAGLTGNFVKGGLVGGLSSNGGFSFGNIGDFNPTNAFYGALSTTLKSIPSAGLSMGVQYITKNMDKQDADIIKNAFSGAYYIVNVPTNYLVEKKVMPYLFPVAGNQPTPSFQQTLGLSPATQNYNQINWEKSYKDYIKAIGQ